VEHAPISDEQGDRATKHLGSSQRLRGVSHIACWQSKRLRLSVQRSTSGGLHFDSRKNPHRPSVKTKKRKYQYLARCT
jgi:hypothetical protein